MNDDNEPTRADAAAFAAERAAAGFSPAQPDGPNRIDADDPEPVDGPAPHVKREHGDRMSN
jgi:hypothetical protein